MRKTIHILRTSFILLIMIQAGNSFGQGRVVINEFMPWTQNNCGTTAEFVELLNFGPGPVNIGCYVLTDGDFSISIPAGTILQPGQFYVIGGQDVIPGPCANIDSTVRVHLNWNSCLCSNAPIPVTGDGLFTDGGFANEQVVLMNPAGTVIDAVIRDLPAEPSSPITTSSASGCTPFTFDLDLMNINYEVLGMSTGRGNSFARKLDGDCGWVKDPQQSANASNNTSNEMSDLQYELSIINSMECSTARGSVDITVRHSNLASVFPMRYTLVRDTDQDGIFGISDQYLYGADSTSPSILVGNMAAGKYRITMESSKGCYLKSMDFTILPCNSTLPVQLIYFRKAESSAGPVLEWRMEGTENLRSVILEKSKDRVIFVESKKFEYPASLSGPYSEKTEVPDRNNGGFFRLKITAKDGKLFYSPVVSLEREKHTNRIWPNPIHDRVSVKLNFSLLHRTPYIIYNSSGAEVARGLLEPFPAGTSFTIPLTGLNAGLYRLHIRPSGSVQPISFGFVKH